MAQDDGTIPVWSDGTAIRAYTHVDDLVEGVYMLMQSDLQGLIMIGGDEYVTVDEAAALTADRHRRLRQGDSGGARGGPRRRSGPQLRQVQDQIPRLGGRDESERGSCANLRVD